jgi:hypothetical protein
MSTPRAGIAQAPNVVSPPCNDQWNVVPSQNSGTNANNELNSVSAISSTDAWAVGDVTTGTSPNFVKQPQAQHWDGSSWTLPPAQPAVVGAGDNALLTVTAVTTTNVWAAGYSKPNNTSGTARQVLIEHYDGTSWTAIADTTTNNPAGTSNSLYGIKFFSATDIWAVGQAVTAAVGTTTPATSTALIEHYDGTSWTVKTGATTSAYTVLSDALPLSATDVWVSGFQQAAGGAEQALVEHYNGTTWTVSATQNPNTGGQFFTDIAGVAGNIWAVGGQFNTSTTDKTLAEHYDGTNWTVVAAPTPELSAIFTAVRYTASNDVWAVGGAAYSAPGTVNELDHTLIEHWDGTAWKQVLSPNPSNNQDLFDIAIGSPNHLLTVGFTQDAINGTASSTLAADLCEPTPAVTGLSPDHANSAGGAAVKITGSGLAYPRSVLFGTTAATSFSANSDSQITAVAPAGAVGTQVNVTVTTMGGTSPTAAGNQYTFFGPGPWDLAGGVLGSGPTASTWGSGRLDAFVTGTDGIVYHRFFDGTNWAWEALPGEASTSDAASVSTVSGSIDVFIHGADNALWRRNFSANAWGATWQRIGGVIVGAPAAVALGSGKIDVFVQGADNHLWLAAFDGVSTWTWSSPGGVLGAPPVATSTGATLADAFVRGTDGALWRWSSAGTWTPLGGQLLGKPAATHRGAVLDVFVQGTDNALWHWTNWGGASLWENVGGKLAAPPAAVSWGGNRMDLLVQGIDAILYHAWTSVTAATGGWSWEGVGGQIMGSPAGVAWGANRLDALVRGTDNRLWHIAFN